MSILLSAQSGWSWRTTRARSSLAPWEESLHPAFHLPCPSDFSGAGGSSGLEWGGISVCFVLCGLGVELNHLA